MVLSDFNKKADEYTAKASEIVRQMLLGAIAVIWLFKGGDSVDDRIDKFLLLPLVSIILGLLSDLLQYVIGGQIWKSFFRKNEKLHKGSDPEIKAPKKYSMVIYVFYWAKISFMIMAYILIVIYLSRKITLA